MTTQLLLVTTIWAVGVGALAVLAQVWYRGLPSRRPALSGIAVAAAVYAFGYGLELASTDLDWALGTFRIQYLGIAAAPSLLLWLASAYDRRGWLAGRAWRVVAVALPVVTWALVATNPYHAWFHVDPAIDASGPIPVITFTRGVGYWAFQAYTAAAVILANLILLDAWRRGRGEERVRARLLFIGSIVPWLANLVHVFGLGPLRIEWMPFLLPLTSWLLYRGVVYHGLAEIGPIARDRLVQRLGDAVVVVDDEGRVLDVNDAAAELLGVRPGSRPGDLGMPLDDLLPALARIVERSPKATVTDAGEIRIGHRAFHVGRQTVGRPGAPAVALVLRDVTHYVELENTLRKLATTDELTGIANRRHFLELADREVARSRRHGRPVGLIIFDLDGFKAVNDAHGHRAGDAVLQAVTWTATGELRSSDVLGRIGGDEFAVLLPEADAQEVARVAERLRAAFDALEVPAYGTRLTTRASVGGCSSMPASPTSMIDLLACADAAQYQAKARGGNAVVVHLGRPAGAGAPVPAQP